MKQFTLLSLLILSVSLFTGCGIFSSSDETVEALIPVTQIDSITNDAEYIYFKYIYTKATPCWQEIDYINEIDGNFINVKIPGIAPAKACSPLIMMFIHSDSISVTGLPAEVTFRFFQTETTSIDTTYTIQ